jgi:flagellum-specific ATP synthase
VSDTWVDNLLDGIANAKLGKRYGNITQIIGLVIESAGPTASIGELCYIKNNDELICKCEVVGFRKTKTLLMPLGEMTGIRPGMLVEASNHDLDVEVGPELLGRVLDGLGNPLDGKGPLHAGYRRDVYQNAPDALQRKRITEPMITGIRAIDSFLTIGKGQRMGIFAGSGVGKSVTMGMIARNCLAKVNVIALIGERGREVREFIEKDLGPEGLARSVVIVATSDQPALVRLKASLVATTISEYFRDQGEDVLLMMDSSTRLAMAQREIGLAVGEPPATKGYTPSVFAFLPRMFERAGTSDQGSITGLYTVLVEGDDMDDPIADSVRSILDGHIVLSRELANKNHYPAIDVLASVSRCRNDVIDEMHEKESGLILRSMAVYKKSEDLISIGAYVRGSDQEIDKSIQRAKGIESFLIQSVDEQEQFSEIRNRMAKLV